MHDIMREDPRRRFTFGFTFENRSLRLCFVGRTEVVVSDPLDIVSVSHAPRNLYNISLKSFSLVASENVGSVLSDCDVCKAREPRLGPDDEARTRQ